MLALHRPYINKACISPASTSIMHDCDIYHTEIHQGNIDWSWWSICAQVTVVANSESWCCDSAFQSGSKVGCTELLLGMLTVNLSADKEPA